MSQDTGERAAFDAALGTVLVLIMLVSACACRSASDNREGVCCHERFRRSARQCCDQPIAA